VSASPAHERPALRRRTEDRLVAGVAGGIADWLNAPAGFIRVVLLLVGSASDIVVGAYAAAALLLPARGHNRPSWDNLIGLGRLGLVFIAPRVAFGESQDLTVFSDESPTLWIPVVALLLVGALILFSTDYVRSRPRTDAEARAIVLAAVPLCCFVAALVAAIVLFPDPRWDRFLPIGVLVAGVALLVGAWTGRARPFVAPAVVAVVLASVLVASDARLEGGVGDVRLTRADAADGSLVVRRASGDVTVDLRHLQSDRPVSLVASVGMGDLRVAVPKQIRLRVDAQVGQGTISSGLVTRGFEGSEGFGAHIARTYVEPRADGSPGPRVHVTADVGIGTIDVGSGRDFLVSRVGP
jgi:phage shock protein PspC (stress-responsive transcriptional regulator)